MAVLADDCGKQTSGHSQVCLGQCFSALQHASAQTVGGRETFAVANGAKARAANVAKITASFMSPKYSALAVGQTASAGFLLSQELSTQSGACCEMA